MDVNRKVLDSVALYMQAQEAQAVADALSDRIGATTRHLSEREYQAYVHITGMYDIAHNAGRQPMVHAESIPIPALTPERLAEYDAAVTRAELPAP